MGTITKRKRKKGITYRAQVLTNGNRTGKTFTRHSEAALWVEEKEEQAKTGILPPEEVAPGDMLFYEAMDRFIIESRASVSRSQINSYENSRKILSRTFPSKTKISEITPPDVSTHVLNRMTVDNVGASSIRNELSFIRGVYQKAVEWGIDIPSPELNIKRPKAKMRSREARLDNVIKPMELRAIFEQAEKSKNNLYYYLTFLLYTGMRPGEAAQLYWERLPVKKETEAERKRLPIGYVDIEDRGGFSKVGTKTEPRFVPAHSKAIEIIERLEADRQEGQLMVFLDNKYLNQDRAYRYYRRAMLTVRANVKIEGKQLRQDINFYSFRHTFRSRLEECGVSTAIAETIIGHSDKSFKFTYIHLSDAALIEAIQKLKYPHPTIDI